MLFSGQISKMISTFNNPIDYFLPIGNKNLYLNDMLGKKIKISYQGKIRCITCNKKIYKTYMQGHCYPCFISFASNFNP